MLIHAVAWQRRLFEKLINARQIPYQVILRLANLHRQFLQHHLRLDNAIADRRTDLSSAGLVDLVEDRPPMFADRAAQPSSCSGV